MRGAVAVLALLALCAVACGQANAASFTIPSFHSDTTGKARLPYAEYCAPSSRAVSGPLYVVVRARRQSPTWLAKRDSMLSSAVVWAKYWPTVVAEAAEVTVSRTLVPASEVGKKYAFTPALNWRPAFVRVSTESASGNESCPSNFLWVP